VGSGPAACPKFDTAKLGSNATRREIILVDPVFNHQGNRGAGAELAMRVVPTLVTGVLLLVSVNVAKAADPTLLAETAAYLLGNAHRCGVADDRVEHAGRVIRDLMVVAAQDTAELPPRRHDLSIFSRRSLSQAKIRRGSHPAKS